MTMLTLNDIVEASAAKFGNKPALIIKPGFRTRTWSYRDLSEVVPRIARHLAESGLRKGDRVITFGVNRPEYGIAMLAALRAGAIVVPLDVNSTTEFVKKISERTRATAVLVTQQTKERAASLGLPLHEMELLPDKSRGKDPLPKADVGPDDLAEIVFTSGTTGEPKGTMLSHNNILSNALAAMDIFPIGPKQRLLSFIPLSHMFEQLAGFWLLLIAGASVVYPTSRQPAVIRRTFKERKVSMILITPAAVRSLLLAIERKAEADGKGPLFEKLRRIARRLPMALRRILFISVHRAFGGRFRYIVSGGAALDPALGEAWRELGVEVLQGYGLSETAPALTFNRLDKNRFGSVGVPLPGVEVRLADDGEVLARGPNIFKGYWENEEATRAALEGGWFHTGDLGTIDADGFLWLHGRKKDMIALPDGLKVYPEDIENVLAADPRIDALATPQRPTLAIAIGLERPDEPVHVHAVFVEPRDPDVIAAIVRDANTKLSGSQQIRGWSIWPDAEFPTTPTQKVKKREVIEKILQMGKDDAPAAEAPPSGRASTELERLIAQVAQVKPDRVWPEAQLSADVGLDSLGRVDLLGVIEEELGVYIDEAALAPSATVAELEAMVIAARDAKPETGIFGWPLSPVVRSVGLILQQVLLWPLVRIFYRVRVTGTEKLHGLVGPVMFAPNHCLHWDNGIILTSIPIAWRWRLAVAAAADDIFGNRLNGIFSAVLANAFPLAREGAIRRSLELLGARLDRKFSVLIYPEGKLTIGGPTQPFKSGTGLIAVEGGTPVVPMKLKIGNVSVLDHWDRTWEPFRSNGWRGNVEVVFGDPLYFPTGTPPADATAKIQAAVAAL
ncbi:MAG TPA: AMP-binding protein [Candidatus Limnocylindrales bacterium]|nr:AMP-binding protein [Candidatus Limnocylindrales bacterium]